MHIFSQNLKNDILQGRWHCHEKYLGKVRRLVILEPLQKHQKQRASKKALGRGFGGGRPLEGRRHVLYGKYSRTISLCVFEFYQEGIHVSVFLVEILRLGSRRVQWSNSLRDPSKTNYNQYVRVGTFWYSAFRIHHQQR